MHILIVDDEAGVRSILSSLVTRAKHQVTAAVSGSQALEFVKQAKTPFDLVVTDHNMPEMPGSEFVRQLRAICPPVQVIVFSAFLSPEVESQYRELGVKKTLSKPAGLRELVGILGALSAPAAIRDDSHTVGADPEKPDPKHGA